MALFQSRAHYENFPVASVLLPRAMRRHVGAVYAFARTADDFADEGDLSPADRCRLLDGWSRRLHHAVRTTEADRPPGPGEPPDTLEIFRALGNTIREKSIPVALLEDLLSAFRQDVTVTRYEQWEDLLDYCRRSANPVGRIVLRIAGHRDAQLDRMSDAFCTALQLTNFWQDLAIDWSRGRLYVPIDLVQWHGAREAELGAGLSTAWRRALAGVVLRTRALFEVARPLCDVVAGRLRWELRATWLGGTRILDKLEAIEYDAFARRPVLGRGDVPWFVRSLCAWVPAPAPRSDTVVHP